MDVHDALLRATTMMAQWYLPNESKKIAYWPFYARKSGVTDDDSSTPSVTKTAFALQAIYDMTRATRTSIYGKVVTHLILKRDFNTIVKFITDNLTDIGALGAPEGWVLYRRKEDDASAEATAAVAMGLGSLRTIALEQELVLDRTMNRLKIEQKIKQMMSALGRFFKPDLNQFASHPDVKQPNKFSTPLVCQSFFQFLYNIESAPRPIKNINLNTVWSQINQACEEMRQNLKSDDPSLYAYQVCTLSELCHPDFIRTARQYGLTVDAALSKAIRQNIDSWLVRLGELIDGMPLFQYVVQELPIKARGSGKEHYLSTAPALLAGYCLLRSGGGKFQDIVDNITQNLVQNNENENEPWFCYFEDDSYSDTEFLRAGIRFLVLTASMKPTHNDRS